MSEDNSQNSSEDTESSVPLKKETTRVTLKAAEGSAPPPPAPGAPPAPKPPAPAAPAAPSPPQATQPLKPAEPAAQPTAAKTVPLNPTPASSPPSQATVKLQPSSPSAPSLPGAGSAPLSTGQLSATLDDEGEDSLPFGVILEHILTLRSSNTALVGDIVDLQHYIKKKSTFGK